MHRERTKRLTALAVALACITAGVSCQRQPEARVGSGHVAPAGLDGATILAQTRAAYAQAVAYRDDAKIYLSYRLAGQLIQEQQPWSTVWSRTQGMKATWFNADLQYDGQRLRCYVYDIETENLDQQCLIIPAPTGLPLDRLWADALAAHFAGGRAEMPLDPRALPQAGALVTPVIGWLTGAGPWEVLQQPERVLRLDDGLVDERPCYRIQVVHGAVRLDLWIDREDYVLRQMTLPIEFLEPAVRQSSEVEQVQFFARMHGATFAPSPLGESFAVSIPSGARLVQQFISLPESFPCQRLGERMPHLGLVGPNGANYRMSSTAGQVSVLMWVGDESPEEVLPLLAKAVEYRWSEHVLRADLVFVDGPAEFGKEWNARVEPWRIAAARHGLDLGLWLDESGAAARSLQLTGLPALVVIAPDETIQYAGRLHDPRWAEKLTAAVERIANGDNLAEEMRQDYHHFLERYHRKLHLVTADPLAGDVSHAMTAPQTQQKRWSLSRLSRPGNVQPHISDPSNEMLVFDGWRTLVRVGFDGQEIERLALQIPVGEAVSIVRQILVDDQRPCYALFSPAARAVFVMDDRWQRLATIQSDSARPDQILDCQFVFDSGLDRWEVWVAFHRAGLVRFELHGQRIAAVDAVTVESLATQGRFCGAIVQGMPVFESCDELGPAIRQLVAANGQYYRVYTTGPTARQSNTDPIYFATRLEPAAGWQLVGFHQGSEQALAAVGSQVFDSNIEPFAALASGDYLAIADGVGNVQVFRKDLSLVALIAVGQPLNGVALVEYGDKLILVTATNHELAGWNIER